MVRPIQPIQRAVFEPNFQSDMERDSDDCRASYRAAVLILSAIFVTASSRVSIFDPKAKL